MYSITNLVVVSAIETVVVVHPTAGLPPLLRYVGLQADKYNVKLTQHFNSTIVFIKEYKKGAELRFFRYRLISPFSNA